MAGEYQFSLIDVTKQQGTKTILKDVNLSFFYGAHIGVIGANGAGKSSLLKILAGLDTELMGTVQVAKGTKVGYLPQEPVLDDSKTVLETVMEGVADAQAMVTCYEDLCCELDDPKAAAEMERLQTTIAWASATPSMTVSRTVFESSSSGSCGRYPTFVPFATCTVPMSSVSRPARIFRSDDLPAPLPPITPMCAP